MQERPGLIVAAFSRSAVARAVTDTAFALTIAPVASVLQFRPILPSVRFEPRSDVHAIAVKIVAVDDQVIQVQPDPKYDPSVCGQIMVDLSYGLLEPVGLIVV